MNVRARMLMLVIWIVANSSVVFAGVTCEVYENTSVPETTPTAEFTGNGDGTVTHGKTGLRWMRCSLGQTWDGSNCIGTAATFTWQQALQAAADVNSGLSDVDGDGVNGFAGYTDWRLPNRKELESIVERRCWSPAINAAAFPSSVSGTYWTSTLNEKAAGSAWQLVFTSGRNVTDAVSLNGSVRLVRAYSGFVGGGSGGF